MSRYFLAMLLLSAGSFIHSRSLAPEMRPASPVADLAWQWLARAALVTWFAMIGWGFATLHWSQPLAALLGSLAVNALLAYLGPLEAWPRISTLFCLGGLGATLSLFLG